MHTHGCPSFVVFVAQSMLSKADLPDFDALNVSKPHACVGRQKKRAQCDAQVMRAVGCTNFALMLELPTAKPKPVPN